MVCGVVVIFSDYNTYPRLDINFDKGVATIEWKGEKSIVS